MKQLFQILLVLVFISFLSTSAFAITPQGPNRKIDPAAKQNTSSGMVRSCEARLTAIKRRMTQLVRLSKTMQEKFDAITTRADNFYLDKVVPTGKTLDNYAELKSEISAKSSNTTIAISESQKDIDSFNCSTDDPKDLYANFIEDMQKVKSSLKEYRTSIRIFIQAIHQLMPEDEEPKVTPVS